MVTEIIHSLQHVIDIGFSGDITPLNTPNMRSASANPTVIDKTVINEVQSNLSAGPYTVPPFDKFVINSIGVVPKKSGGHRMITDLSRPEDGMNAHIDKDQFTMV